MNENGIEERMLKLLLSASSKTYFVIKCINGGYTLLVRTPKDFNDNNTDDTEYTEFILNRTNGTGIRVWRSLDNAYGYISKFTPEWKKIEIIR